MKKGGFLLLAEDKEKLLTEAQVWDVIEFARSFNKDLKWLYGGGVYTPEILNKNLLGLNNDAETPTYDKVIKTLGDAVGNVDTINSFVQFMDEFDTIFNKVLNYKCNMLSFDLSYVCTNATSKDYNKKEYKEDKERVRKFLFNFDYKKYFPIVVKNLMMNGKYFCWFREGKKDNGGAQKYALQMLPQNRCKITGYSNLGALFDIDLSFLLSGTVDLGLYDDMFGKYYKEIFKEENLNKYIPSNSLNKRDGSWAYWVQTSPKDGAWCFLFDESNFAGVSPMAPFLKDTILGAEIQKLQYDKDIATAHAILAGEIRMKKDSKQPNDFAIDPKLLGELLNLVQTGLGNMFKVAAMPTENQKFFQYKDENPQMYSEAIKNTTTLGASASRIIYDTDKASEAELIAQITTDAAPLKKLYRQFEQFLNYVVNQKTRKYNFSFHFTGIDYWFDKEDRRDALEFAIDRGVIPNLSFFAQALGYPPHVFEQAINEGKNGDLSDMLGQLVSIHTTAGGALNDEGGRPRKRRVKSDSRDYDKKKTGKRT